MEEKKKKHHHNADETLNKTTHEDEIEFVADLITYLLRNEDNPRHNLHVSEHAAQAGEVFDTFGVGQSRLRQALGEQHDAVHLDDSLVHQRLPGGLGRHLGHILDDSLMIGA